MDSKVPIKLSKFNSAKTVTFQIVQEVVMEKLEPFNWSRKKDFIIQLGKRTKSFKRDRIFCDERSHKVLPFSVAEIITSESVPWIEIKSDKLYMQKSTIELWVPGKSAL